MPPIQIGQRDDERTRKKVTKRSSLISRPKGRANDIDLADVMGYSDRRRDFRGLRVSGYMRCQSTQFTKNSYNINQRFVRDFVSSRLDMNKSFRYQSTLVLSQITLAVAPSYHLLVGFAL